MRIAYNTLNEQTQENLRQAMEYIDRITGYDVNFIRDNICSQVKVSQNGIILKKCCRNCPVAK